MLPGDPKNDPNNSWGSRAEYLALPHNHPKRVLMRALEVQYGQMYLEINEREAASGGFFSSCLAAMGAIGGFVLLGPAGIAGGAILGGAVGAGMDAFIKVRLLGSPEWARAKEVFGDSLPPRENILLTNLNGVGGRPFVFPASSLGMVGALVAPIQFAWLVKNPGLFGGKAMMNVGGKIFDDAFRNHKPSMMVPGQTLIHELTHVWQIRHSNSSLCWLCEGIVAQIGDSLGGYAYAVQPGKQWREYGADSTSATKKGLISSH